MVTNVMPITQDVPMPQAASRLCNFVTGQSTLLQDHKTWIDSTLGRRLMQLNGAWIDLVGYASKLGNTESNKHLSSARVEEVRKYISTWKTGINFQKEVVLGEEQSTGEETNNDGYFRAVEVYLYGAPPPPLRQRIERKRPQKPKFAIRLVSSLSVSFGVPGVDAVAFDIGEPSKAKWRKFWYIGGSMNVAVKLPKILDLPGGVGGSGPSVLFTANRRCEIEDFEGEATLFSSPGAGLGPLSVGGEVGLTIESSKLKQKGVILTPRIVMMNNDSGIQLSLGGAGKGYLHLHR